MKIVIRYALMSYDKGFPRNNRSLSLFIDGLTPVVKAHGHVHCSGPGTSDMYSMHPSELPGAMDAWQDPAADRRTPDDRAIGVDRFEVDADIEQWPAHVRDAIRRAQEMDARGGAWAFPIYIRRPEDVSSAA